MVTSLDIYGNKYTVENVENIKKPIDKAVKKI